MKLCNFKNNAGIFLLALGGIFLCNPVMELYDVLPDLFGYILIYFGLWRLSDLCDEFVESMRLFRAMMWVSAGQLAAQWLLHDFLPAMTQNLDQTGGSINQYEAPVLTLVLAFAWAILSWYFLIPAFKHLFCGFGTLALHVESKALQKERKEKPLWKRTMGVSVCFAILLPLLTLLPELSILTSFAMDTGEIGFDWYDFIWMFRAVLGIASGVVGLLWLGFYWIFYIKLLRDKPFCEGVWAWYDKDVAPRVTWLAFRRWSLAILLISAGILFAADVRMDSRPIFLSAISAVLICAGYMALGTRRVGATVSLCAVGGLLTAVSLQHRSLLNAYLLDHTPEEALYLPRAYNKFLQIRILELVQAVLVFVLLLLTFILFWRAVKQLEARINADLVSRDKRVYLIKLSISFLLLIGYAVASCFNAIFQLDLKLLWWISFALILALFFLFRSLMLDIKEEISFCAQKERTNKEYQNNAY